MLQQFGQSTIVAVALGTVLALLAFLPVVAIRYRKAGRLRFIDILLLIATAMYSIALWSYTLIPLPETLNYRCVGTNFDAFGFIGDIQASLELHKGGSWITNREVLQVVLNIFLFMPLGALIRWLGKRGVAVATMSGFAISAFIECTQLTGDWWIYPCAYRVFDVDDMILNTTGALLGSLVAFPIARLISRGGSKPKITYVTAGRRIIGTLADAMFILFTEVFCGTAFRAMNLYLFNATPDNINPVAEHLFTWVPISAFYLLLVLYYGRTFGEMIVGLRPVEPQTGKLRRRVVKLLVGAGGFIILSATPINSLIALAFVLVSLIAIFPTKDHQGLSGLVAGLPMKVDD